MTNRRKNILNILFLLFVFAFTVYHVFEDKDIGEIVRLMRTVRLEFLIPGVLCVLLFIGGESVIIHYLMSSLSIRIRGWKCFLFSSVGFFFSCITPSASGGQPMQVYYMKKERIPVPVSTLVLLIVTITYKSVLVLIGAFLWLCGRSLIRTYLTEVLPVFYPGLALNVVCVALMLITVFHQAFAGQMMQKALKLLEQIHILKKREDRRERLEHSMIQYRETAEYLKSHRRVMGNVLLLTFLQRIALFSTTYFVYCAFGLHGTTMPEIVLLQAVISVAVDMLPLPGGMGISEKLFLTIFAPVFGVKLLLPAMILSRGLSYYAQLFISALMTAVAQLTLGKEKKKEKKNDWLL